MRKNKMRTDSDYKKIVMNIYKWILDEKEKRYNEGIENGLTFNEYRKNCKDLETIENFISGDDY